MTKHNTIQDRLARSLDQANKKAAETAPAPLPAAEAPASKCSKRSISLYPTDLKEISKIRSYMAERGHHISESMAVRLAVRTVTLLPVFDSILIVMQNEDQRKGW